MEIDLIPILSTIILATTIVTIVLAVGSYAAYKLRDKRRARRRAAAAVEEAPQRLFRRYRPGRGARRRA
jgi:hypothetical protein